jgi:histidyl-tRNA synthetase
LAYAERKGFQAALIAGSDEFASGMWKIKVLKDRSEVLVTEADLITEARKVVGSDV